MPVLFLSHSGSDTEAAKALKKRIEDSPAATEAGLKEGRPSSRDQAQLATIEREVDAFAVFVG